ncbi:MAG: sterol desaturase family protein [Chitinophagales bacterium]|nr:sterol desaturase family protein [Chitinophagales bacterium]MDW8274003.1 sterol desaturase family protein [Chitinophagales bacterium]
MALNFQVVPLEKEPVVYAIPFFLLLIGIELYLNWKEQRQLYHGKEAISSIAMGLGSMVVNIFMKALAFAAYSWLHQFRLFDIGWHWWSWLLILFADDFTFYWHHRLSHEIRILWAAHVQHHSAQTLNLAIALRQSWTELLYKYVWWCWLPLIGFEPLMILMMMSISLIYQFWPHTEIIKKLPRWFEFIFNTPSHHRVHHASNPRYLDQNHAGILIIWDRLFGTFTEEKENDKPVYGLTKNIDSYNPLVIVSHEYKSIWEDVKRAPTFADKLKYIFYPPGWSHDGPDLRAKTLRKQVKD